MESSAAKCAARAARQSAVNCVVAVAAAAAFDYMHYLLLFMRFTLIVPVRIVKLRTARRIRDANIAHTTCETPPRDLRQSICKYFKFLLQNCALCR